MFNFSIPFVQHSIPERQHQLYDSIAND